MAALNSRPVPGPPRHQWPGVVIVCELCLVAAGMLVVAAAAFTTAYAMGGGVMTGLIFAIPVVFIAVGCGLLAWGVWHFESWSLWAGLLAPAVVALASASLLYRTVTTGARLWWIAAAAALIGVMVLQAVCWRYLWRRRPDFDDAPPWPGPSGRWLRRGR